MLRNHNTFLSEDVPISDSLKKHLYLVDYFKALILATPFKKC